MNDIGIYIPSSHRADKLRTTHHLPLAWKEFTTLVVPYDQYAKYQEHTDWPILRLPRRLPQYIAHQRQWIMENSPYDYVWMMDDDLTFQYRKEKGSTKLTNCTQQDLLPLLKLFRHHLADKTVSVVGVSMVFGNNWVPEPYLDNQRVIRCFCINKKEFNDLGIHFSFLDGCLMSDLHVLLSFLENGRKIRCLYTYAQNDLGYNAPGGCSVYRKQNQTKSAKMLARLHPKVVHLCNKSYWDKSNKSCNKWWDTSKHDNNKQTKKLDVTIQWKKAYIPKRDKKSGIAGFIT